MEKKEFLNQKLNFLAKSDKSKKGSFDNKIIKICNKINLSDNYYTTSSCSGRVVLLKQNKGKKHETEWLNISHDFIDLDFFLKLKNNFNEKIIFKFESVILHVTCFNLKFAGKLVQLARENGFRRSGVITCSNKIVVELVSNIKTELVIYDQKQLISNSYINYLIKDTNNKFKINWDIIKNFEEKLNIIL